MSETKYFRAENANRLIGGVKFEPLEVRGGTLVGLFAAAPPLSDQLAALAANPANALEEISEETYLEELKKKAPHLAASPHSSPSSPPVTPIKGKGGAVVVQGSEIAPPPAPEGAMVEKAEEALKVGEVAGTVAENPPGTPVPEDQKQNEPKVAKPKKVATSKKK